MKSTLILVPRTQAFPPRRSGRETIQSSCIGDIMTEELLRQGAVWCECERRAAPKPMLAVQSVFYEYGS
jgi:hypothetical protein